MDADRVGRLVDEAIMPMVASLGSWGVEAGHWLPDRDGRPVVWLCTRTASERAALERQVWLLPQVQVTLTRLGVPHEVVWPLRLEVTSTEDQRRLFREAAGP